MVKTSNRNVFVMSEEWSNTIRGLSDEQCGKIIKAIYAKHLDGIEPDFGDDNMMMLFFNMMYKPIEMAESKYKAKCRKNASNAITRWNKKTPRSDDIPSDAKRRITLEYNGVPGCYAFIDENRKLLYIGKSENLAKRIPSSYKERRDIVNIKMILAYKTKTETEAQYLEAMLIAENKPLLNIAGADNDVAESCGVDVLRDFHIVHVFD